MFHLVILESRIRATENILFDGNATSVMLPGAEGEFEILDFHKPIVSKLKKGIIVVDNSKEFPIVGGLAKMSHQNLVAVVEL